MSEPTVLDGESTSGPGTPDVVGTGPGTTDAVAPPTPKPRRNRWRLWGVAAVLVGAFSFLLVEGLGSSLNYFETVD